MASIGVSENAVVANVLVVQDTLAIALSEVATVGITTPSSPPVVVSEESSEWWRVRRLRLKRAGYYGDLS